jgi:malonyl-CoA O-methyltransferase
MSRSTQIGLPEPAATRRRFDRAAATFDDADAVHAEARARLLQRLQYVTLTPERVIDLGSATGGGSEQLVGAYPEAQIIAIDASLPLLRRAKDRGLGVTTLAGDAERLPLADNSADLIFANLLLPWCAPDAVFSEAARVLRKGGVMTFTSFGPDTLAEVREAWAAVDDSVHVHGFLDMHDIGDLALRAGLTEPVMDVDRMQVTYRRMESLFADLRRCGATNVAAGRRTTLTGKSRWRAFCDALAEREDDGCVAVSIELVFGQAWGGGDKPMRGGDAFSITLEEFARQLK